MTCTEIDLSRRLNTFTKSRVHNFKVKTYIHSLKIFWHGLHTYRILQKHLPGKRLVSAEESQFVITELKQSQFSCPYKLIS